MLSGEVWLELAEIQQLPLAKEAGDQYLEFLPARRPG